MCFIHIDLSLSIMKKKSIIIKWTIQGGLVLMLPKTIQIKEENFQNDIFT
jgi:hypothetical protein